MRIKRSLKVVALVLAVLVSFPSAALAALPSNTIVFGTKAYDLSLLDDASVANEILAAFVANGNLFAYKMPAGNFIDPNDQAIDPATLPAVTYVDAAKVSTNYQAGDGDVVPTAVTLTGVTATMSVQAEQTAQITATAVPADATVTYASSDETKATVSSTGLVTGVAAGTATITVTAAKSDMISATGTVAVTVTAIPIVAVTVGSPTMSLAVGATGTIVATPTPSDATVTFASLTPAVATVHETTGVVTAVAVGTATINVTAAKTDYTTGTATVDVTVTDIVAPAIAEAEFVDYQTLKVTFTEEVVESEAGLVVTSNDVEVDAVLADDGMSLTIVDEDGFAAADYTVVVNGLEDLAGNAMEADTTTPVVTKNASYIAKFEIETTTIPVGTEADVEFYYTTEDQYGEPFTTADELADFVDAFSATARVGGFPLPGVTVGTGDDAGKITLGADAALKEGAVVTATLKNTVEDVVVATLVHELTVVDEIAEATYIKSLEVDPDADLVANETVVDITIEVLDQFFRPMLTPNIRWETSDKTVVAFNADNDWTVTDTDTGKVQVDFLKDGSATITAYLVDNIAVSESIDLNIGATRLAVITMPAFADPTGYNHEEIESGKLTYTTGAILTPDMLKFEITGVPEDATEDDISITAGYDKDNDIILTVVTSEAGTYKFKAFVGDDEDAIVSEEVTVTTTINPEVASIDAIEFAENELTVGGIVEKDLVFRNEHGEAVYVATDDLVLAFLADKVEVEVLDTIEGNVVGLKFTGLVVGNWTVTLSTGDVVKEIAVPVVEAAAVESISIAATVTVIKADVYDDVEDETIFFHDGQAYKIMPVVFYNQYGNPMDVSDAVLDEIGDNLLFVELKAVEGGYAEAGDDADIVVAIGVHATVDAGEEETFILEVDELDSADVTVTVLDAREADSIEIDEFATSLLLEAVVTINVPGDIAVLDQYGVSFVPTLVEGEGDYQVLAASTDEEVIEVGYTGAIGETDITLTAVNSGNAKVTVSLVRVTSAEPEVIDSAEYDMTGSSQDEIARLEISAPFDMLILGGDDTVYVEDRTEVTLVVKAYDEDDKEIAVSLADFDWFTSDVAKATVDNGVVTAAADGEATIKAVSLGGAQATIVITVSNEMVLASVAFADDTPNEVAVEDTIELADDVRFFDKNGYEILPTDVVLDNFVANDIAYRWTSTNEAVASVDADGSVTGVAVGTATIRVMLQDSVDGDLGIYATIKISVTE